ncbi:MAG: hypothetical protein WC909_01875 [Candidatus Paceibacterota bacterium]|jgi:hypothetical protein
MFDKGYAELIILFILFVSLGYFMYGVDGVFAIAILYMICLLLILLCYIPFIGIILQYWISMKIVLPLIISITGIESTWLTTIVIIYTMILGFILWSKVTIKAIILIKEYIDNRRYIHESEANAKEKLLKSETPAEAGNNH